MCVGLCVCVLNACVYCQLGNSAPETVTALFTYLLEMNLNMSQCVKH